MASNDYALNLIGDTNDYCGKGLSGGRIIVRPNTEFRGWAVDNIIIGNTVLYGAISGEAFFNGVAGVSENIVVQPSASQAGRRSFSLPDAGPWIITVQGVGAYSVRVVTE